jgi:putative addiction module component (TIGR02574 family)
MSCIGSSKHVTVFDMNRALNDILKLTPQERLEIIAEIWQSLEDDLALTDAQAAELNRRLEDHHQNPTDTISWEALAPLILSQI